MKMVLKLIIFSIFVLIYSNAVPVVSKPSSMASSVTPECSTNASTAWLDVILMIDTSTNMGSANLRKIATLVALVMSKFTLGNVVYFPLEVYNTRVGVITYDKHAQIVANFTDIYSLSDLSNVLNRIQVSNNSDANLYDAFMQPIKCFVPSNICSKTEASDGVSRPTAWVVFASSLSSPSANQNLSRVAPQNLGITETIITVNFNSSDTNLTKTLDMLTLHPLLNVSMYNLVSTSNTLASNLQWAILQANCFCTILNYVQLPLVLFDKTNNRYSRYAYCIYEGFPQGGYIPTESIDLCPGAVPIALLSAEYENFVQKVWLNDKNFSAPYYIGLHKNPRLIGYNDSWVWYDQYYASINFTETPATYFNWAPGYPKGQSNETNVDARVSSNCAIIECYA